MKRPEIAICRRFKHLVSPRPAHDTPLRCPQSELAHPLFAEESSEEANETSSWGKVVVRKQSGTVPSTGRQNVLQWPKVLLTPTAKPSLRITTTLAVRLHSTTRTATKHALELRFVQSHCVAESAVHARRSITGNFALAIFTVVRHWRPCVALNLGLDKGLKDQVTRFKFHHLSETRNCSKSTP
jgi:hypothetical protein